MHSEDISMPANPRVVVSAVRDAHEFFVENRIDVRYHDVTLDLIRRYVSLEGTPREPDSLYAAALFMVSRHPWSYPNPLTKNEFAGRFRIKETSIDWYTDSIIEKLGFLIFHDNNQFPFYVDPQGTIASVINSIVHSSVGEEVVRSIVRGNALAPEILAEKIVDRLCNIVKIIPVAFEHEVYRIVLRMIDTTSHQLLNELGQT
jgi:hypothetical protein